MTRHRVFVYGTLKRGERNHGLLKHTEFVGAASVFGYAMYDLGSYPGIVSVADLDSEVLGEVFVVDEDTLQSLDDLEAEGQLYRRVVREIDDESTFIYVYLLSVESHQQIANGRY